MVSFSLAIAVTAAAAILTPSAIEAHGFLVKPKTTFKTYGGGYSAIVQNSTLTPPAGKRFIWYQDQIAGIFQDALKPTGLSLKDFILKNQDTSVQAEGAPKPLSAACGFSDPKGTPQPLPDKLQWEMGFLHPGPCEVYCGDELVVPYTTDCWNTFKDNLIPYDKAKCVGKKQLTLYFLAVHYPPWQVYINCVPLSGAASGGSSSTAPIPVTTTLKPAPAATPKPTTKAPASTPKATTKKPVATPKPTPTSSATDAPTTTTPPTKAPSMESPTSTPVASTAKPSPTAAPSAPDTASEATQAPAPAPLSPPPVPSKDGKICATKSSRRK